MICQILRCQSSVAKKNPYPVTHIGIEVPGLLDDPLSANKAQHWKTHSYEEAGDEEGHLITQVFQDHSFVPTND